MMNEDMLKKLFPKNSYFFYEDGDNRFGLKDLEKFMNIGDSSELDIDSEKIDGHLVIDLFTPYHSNSHFQGIMGIAHNKRELKKRALELSKEYIENQKGGEYNLIDMTLSLNKKKYGKLRGLKNK